MSKKELTEDQQNTVDNLLEDLKEFNNRECESILNEVILVKNVFKDYNVEKVLKIKEICNEILEVKRK